MNTGNVEAYRENIVEARRALAVAQERFGKLKDADMIFWGKINLKSGSEYEGWLVKGKGADEAFTARAKAGSDLMHWLRLLAAEEAAPMEEQARAPITITPDEKARRIIEIQDEMAKRLGEKPDDDEGVPF